MIKRISQQSTTEAETLFNDMKQRQQSPDTFTYNLMLGMWARNDNWDRVISLWKEMSEYNVTPDVVSYNVLASVYEKQGKFQELENLFGEMIQQRVYPDLFTCNSLLRLYSNSSHEQKTKAVRRVMQYLNDRGLAPDAPLYSTLLSIFASISEVRKAEAIWNELISRDDIQPTIGMFGMVLKMWMLEGSEAKVLEVLQHMEQQNVQPNLVIYNMLIHYWMKQGNEIAAMKTLKEMSLNQIVPDTISFNVMIQTLANRNKVEIAYDVLDLMVKSNVQPDIFTYSSLINYHVRKGQLREVQRLWEELVEKGIKPTLTMCLSVLSLWRKQGVDTNKVIQMKHYLNSIQLELDSSFYNCLISIFAERSAVDQIVTTLIEMSRKHIPVSKQNRDKLLEWENHQEVQLALSQCLQ